MPTLVYDKEDKKAPEWDDLYNIWRHGSTIGRASDFSTFLPFFDWAIAHGYTKGDRIKRIDTAGILSRNNLIIVKKRHKLTICP